MGPLENAETRAAEGPRGTGRVAAAHARAPLPPPAFAPPPPRPTSPRPGGGGLAQKYGAALSKGSTQKYNLGKLRADRTFERISQKYNREIVLSNGGGEGLKSRTGSRWPGPSDASGAGVAARPFQRAPGRCAQKYTQKYTQRAHETIRPFLLSLKRRELSRVYLKSGPR